jgi:hypothetical protein
VVDLVRKAEVTAAVYDLVRTTDSWGAETPEFVRQLLRKIDALPVAAKEVWAGEQGSDDTVIVR